MKKVLYAYCRRSSNAAKSNSIETQGHNANIAKEQHGFDELIIFNEGEGVSGANFTIETRPKLFELIHEIDEGNCKHLWANDFERLSRNESLNAAFNSKIINNDVLLYLGKNNPISMKDDPNAKALIGIQGVFAELFRSNTRLKIIDSLKTSRRKGKWNGPNVVYGYCRNDEGKIIVDENESRIYLKMIDMVLNKNKSIRQITNWLNENNINTKIQNVNKKGFIEYKNKETEIVRKVDVSSMIWKDNVVRSILMKTYYYGKRIDKYGKEFDFAKIIDKSKWDQVQQKLKSNTSLHKNNYRKYGNKQKHNYLLKNLIYCNKCDRKFYGRIKTDERTYYCSGKRKEFRLKNQNICSIPSTNLDRFEKFIWENLTRILSDSHLVKEEFKLNAKSEWEEINNKKKFKDIILKLQRKKTDIEENMDVLIGRLLARKITEKIYDKNYNRLTTDLNDINVQIQDAENNLKILKDRYVFIDWVERFKKEVEKWKKDASFKYKRQKVEKYISKIVVDYDQKNETHLIDLHLNYPIINDQFIRLPKRNEKNEYYKLNEGNSSITINYTNKPHIKLSQHLLYYNDMRLCHQCY